MWILLNNAFFSIVDKAEDRGRDLHVRARRANDIPDVFGVEVIRTPDADYLYRADIPREDVARVVASQITAIDYNNFKASVRDHTLHDAYLSVWSALQDTDERYASHE